MTAKTSKRPYRVSISAFDSREDASHGMEYIEQWVHAATPGEALDDFAGQVSALGYESRAGSHDLYFRVEESTWLPGRGEVR